MNKTKYISGTAVLSALAIIFTLISNYIQIGPISLNLSLFPIALAGIILGPLGGFITGFVNGAFILLAPSTNAFFALSAFGTVLICLFKTSIAGLVAGLIYKLFKNKKIAIVLSSIATPIINTTLFIIGSLIFFKGAFGELITIFISLNFFVEILTNVLLVPALKIIINQINFINN